MIQSPYNLSLFGESQVEFFEDSDQRYTPKREYLKVVQCLGQIGLDPTSNSIKSIPALHHITTAQNCFTTDWEPLLQEVSTAFMNPPYSDTTPFLERMVEYLRLGVLRQAVTLTLSGVLQNKSSQNLIRQYGVAICAPHGRINFVGGKGSNDRDVIWVLWGEDACVDRFAAAFDGLICIVKSEVNNNEDSYSSF
jgi:hypothetical protein